jgi:hypothetical protein
MTGLRSRIGERRHQDAAICIALTIEMQRRLEAQLTLAVDSDNKEHHHEAAESGAFFVLTYCGSLRGFETTNILIADLRKQTLSPEESRAGALMENYPPPHIPTFERKV